MSKSVLFGSVLFGLAAAIGVLVSNEAYAHAMLKHAQPSAGAKLSAPPRAVTLEFGEGVVPKLSGIEIHDAAGKPIRTGKPTKGDGAASLTVSISQLLASGTYTVIWHAVSVDTHRTQGQFSFTIAR